MPRWKLVSVLHSHPKKSSLPSSVSCPSSLPELCDLTMWRSCCQVSHDQKWCIGHILEVWPHSGVKGVYQSCPWWREEKGLSTSGGYHHTTETFQINTFLASYFKTKSALTSVLLGICWLLSKWEGALVLAGHYSRCSTVMVKNSEDGTSHSPYSHTLELTATSPKWQVRGQEGHHQRPKMKAFAKVYDHHRLTSPHTSPREPCNCLLGQNCHHKDVFRGQLWNARPDRRPRSTLRHKTGRNKWFF